MDGKQYPDWVQFLILLAAIAFSIAAWGFVSASLPEVCAAIDLPIICDH